MFRVRRYGWLIGLLLYLPEIQAKALGRPPSSSLRGRPKRNAGRNRIISLCFPVSRCFCVLATNRCSCRESSSRNNLFFSSSLPLVPVTPRWPPQGDSAFETSYDFVSTQFPSILSYLPLYCVGMFYSLIGSLCTHSEPMPVSCAVFVHSQAWSVLFIKRNTICNPLRFTKSI